MPKLKLGAVVYALAAVVVTLTVILMIRHEGQWREVHGWDFTVLLSTGMLTAVLLAVGAVTRRGLAADDGPRICQQGWIVLIALTAVVFVVGGLSNEEVMPWPWVWVVFVPHWIRRAQESYYEGVAEAEREIALKAAGPDGELPPGS